MKKNLIKWFGLLLILLTCTTSISASSYQIYVHDIQSDEMQYKIGEVVKGTFTVSNLSNLAQSDIYYTFSAGQYLPDSDTVVGRYGGTEKTGPIYIKANSKKVIPFSYTLPKSLSGNVAIQIFATLKDGTPVGQGDAKVLVEGTKVESAYVMNQYLMIEDQDGIIPVTSGPTVYDGKKINFSYSISSTTRKYTVTPVLKLYDRVDNPDALKQTVRLTPIVTDTTGKAVYTMALPSDIDPLVYLGVISFESSEVEISPIVVRYIIDGTIATIRNITTDTLEVKKGDMVKALVSYGGQPIDQSGQSYKQTEATSTIITVTATNEKNEIVGTISQPLDLSNPKREITLSFTAENDAKSLSFVSTIKTLDGRILDEYATKLPTLAEVQDQSSYGKVNEQSMIKIIVATLLIILIVVGLFIFANKKRMVVKSRLSIFIGIVLFGSMIFGLTKVTAMTAGDEASDFLADIYKMMNFQQVQGWKSLQDNDSNDSFKVTAVSSPLPPQIYTYAPGERFKLNFSAVYTETTADHVYYWAYAPTTLNWYNPNKRPPLEESNEDQRKLWWQDNNNGAPLLDAKDPQTLIALFHIADFSVVTGVSEAREAAIRSLASTYIFKEVCLIASRYGYCEQKERRLHVRLYDFGTGSDDGDFVLWAKSNYNKAETLKNSLVSYGKIDRTDSLGSFDFRNIDDLRTVEKCDVNSYGNKVNCRDVAYDSNPNDGQIEKTERYIMRLKALNGELEEYVEPSLTTFAKTYNENGPDWIVLPVNLIKVYNMPREPGYHKLNFYISQQGRNGRRDQTVRQIVCVKGGGSCPEERDPGNKPVDRILGVNGIQDTSANLNWKYYDPNEDLQIDYDIQLSKTQGDFSNPSKGFSIDSTQVNANAIRDHIMTGLAPGTKYFVRIKSRANAEPDWSEWTDENWSFTTTGTKQLDADKNCICNGRSYDCTENGITTTSAGNTLCALKSTCIVRADTTNTTFTIAPAGHILGNITYTRGTDTPVTKPKDQTYTYAIPRVSGPQSISVLLKDIDDVTTTATCSITNSGDTPGTTTPPVTSCYCLEPGITTMKRCTINGVPQAPETDSSFCPLTLTPSLSITKKPSVTLNRGGSCIISWTITNMPNNTICELTGWGVTGLPVVGTTSVSSSDSKTIPGLLQNQKYSITCSSPSAGENSVALTKSVICRVNPDVIEN